MLRNFNYKNGINQSSRVYIIAEIGVNHNGEIDLAKILIDKAKESGADAVKFQTFKAAELAISHAPKAEYQKETDGKDRSQKDMLQSLELSFTEFNELKEYCDNLEIDFISSPFDLESVDALDQIRVDIYKIPSGEITNAFLLEKLGTIGKPVILSTGMSSFGEITKAKEMLNLPDDKIAILHCVSCYPTKFENINMKRIKLLENEFPNNIIGFSDHTKEYWTPIVAVSMGARIIEKHFTLDKSMQGPDHRASLDTDELTNMVKHIRGLDDQLKAVNVDKIQGCEEDVKNVARKSLVFSKPIKEGELISRAYLKSKRPGTGISPDRYTEIIGKKSKGNFETDHIITEIDFE